MGTGSARHANKTFLPGYLTLRELHRGQDSLQGRKPGVPGSTGTACSAAGVDQKCGHMQTFLAGRSLLRTQTLALCTARPAPSNRALATLSSLYLAPRETGTLRATPPVLLPPPLPTSPARVTVPRPAPGPGVGRLGGCASLRALLTQL